MHAGLGEHGLDVGRLHRFVLGDLGIGKTRAMSQKVLHGDRLGRRYIRVGGLAIGVCACHADLHVFEGRQEFGDAGSVSWMTPSSTSIMAATETSGLGIQQIGSWNRGVHRRSPALGATMNRRSPAFGDHDLRHWEMRSGAPICLGDAQALPDMPTCSRAVARGWSSRAETGSTAVAATSIAASAVVASIFHLHMTLLGTVFARASSPHLAMILSDVVAFEHVSG